MPILDFDMRLSRIREIEKRIRGDEDTPQDQAARAIEKLLNKGQ